MFSVPASSRDDAAERSPCLLHVGGLTLDLLLLFIFDDAIPVHGHRSVEAGSRRAISRRQRRLFTTRDTVATYDEAFA